jgi:hypothetical protein
MIVCGHLIFDVTFVLHFEMADKRGRIRRGEAVGRERGERKKKIGFLSFPFIFKG